MPNSLDIRAFAQTLRAHVTGAFNKRIPIAESRLQNVMMQDVRQFVPYDTGRLDASIEPTSSRDPGVTWTADYAWHVFHMPKDYDFTRTVHPKATSEWTHVAIEQYKQKWLDVFERTLRGY